MPIFDSVGRVGSSATTALEFANQATNNCWDLAKKATNAFDDITAGAVSRIDAQSADDALVIDRANETPVVEPVVTIPTSVNPTDVMSLFDTKYTELVSLLVSKFTTFQTTYFPTMPPITRWRKRG